ncbi:DUF805 domain-containing protein [Serratia sp. DD3]|uniref:DUF805 domain-containing protein n=1 Tax=Serratia sp. DD3 TaxID=1410619 RepID=UPI0003C529BC|nr:DUF805 domain-containing protein [Serratia sp. DD3]KEY58906.1 inner membrane protein YhaH [Serratia sp. DD3]
MEQSVFACYLAGWKKCFVYQGTASRKEFWSFILGNLLIVLLLLFLSFLWLVVGGYGGMAMVWIFYVVFPLLTFVPLLLLLPVTALGIRRMHDIGKSGWWFGGVLVFNLIILPVIQMSILSFFINSRGYDEGVEVVSIINMPLFLISLVFTLWLCSQPTKIISSPSSPDVTN